jgi:hypothetical protein
MGAAAFESLLPTTVVTPRRTGGTSLAFAEISFGGNLLSSTLATSSLRTSTFLLNLLRLGFLLLLWLFLLLRYGHGCDKCGELEFHFSELVVVPVNTCDKEGEAAARRR